MSQIFLPKPGSLLNEVNSAVSRGVIKTPEGVKPIRFAPQEYEAAANLYVPPIERPRNVPNKLATNDPRWENKVAFSSMQLLEKQRELATYSTEVAMIFEGLRLIATKVLGRRAERDELSFYANFGSPIVDNRQSISISMGKPITLKVMLVRALVKGGLKWTAEVSADADTPLTVQGRTINLARASRELGIDPELATAEDEDDKSFKELPSVVADSKRRKVKL